MQGLWKDSRKRFLKDKCSSIAKSYLGFRREKKDKSIYSYDCTYIEPHQEKAQTINVCEIIYDNKVYDTAYEKHGFWFDYITNKKICDKRLDNMDKLHIVKVLFTKNIKFVFNRNIKEFKSKELLYGKALDKEFVKRTRYLYKKSKRWYKEYVNGKDRAILRKHIASLKGGDYDSEIDTHQYSKSLKYLIY